MHSLEARLSRLEERAKRRNNRAPSLAEYLDASFRQRTRCLYNAKLRLYRNMDGGEEKLRQQLSDHDRDTLESDTEEQREKDVDVLRRYERAHGTAAGTAGHATAARLRLRAMKRVTVVE